MRGTGNIPRDHTGEVVTGIKVSVSVVNVDIRDAVCKRASVLADLVKRMTPGVSKLRVHSMPGAKPQRGLECAVNRSADATELVNVIEICISCDGTDVLHDRQPATLRAYVSDLPNCQIAESLLNIQAVFQKIRRTEVLVDCKDVQRQGTTSHGVETSISRRASLYGGEDLDIRLPRVGSLTGRIF